MEIEKRETTIVVLEIKEGKYEVFDVELKRKRDLYLHAKFVYPLKIQYTYSVTIEDNKIVYLKLGKKYPEGEKLEIMKKAEKINSILDLAREESKKKKEENLPFKPIYDGMFIPQTATDLTNFSCLIQHSNKTAIQLIKDIHSLKNQEPRDLDDYMQQIAEARERIFKELWENYPHRT